MGLRTRGLLSVVILLLALVAAACEVVGGSAEPAQPGASPEAAAADAAGRDAFHGVDIAFLQSMVPHHEEAVEMARMVEDRTDRAPLHDLAEDIIASQEAELARMDELLAEAGAERDGPAAGGTMDPEDMEHLASLEGTEFDLAFVDLMIEHHEDGIEAAERVLDAGQHPQVRQLADEIITEQRAEIERMRAWREVWAAEGA